MPRLVALLLLPFSGLYAGVLAVRNWLYDTGLWASAAFAVPLINVGNLRVGGTGKTPHVAWLVQTLLAAGARPAILSRGYGRQTQGFRLAAATDTAASLGDEPRQHYHDFRGNVPVAVCEDRATGVRRLLALHPEISVVVLDDAYQHRRVRPALNILLTEQERPFYHDWVLPAGRLRESRRGARRADVVVVTKCPPNLSAATQAQIISQVRRYARPQVPVLFSAYAYGELVAVNPAAVPPAAREVLLVTGIAQPGALRAYLAQAGYRVVHHFAFPDHHAFSAANLTDIAAQLQPGQCVLTTQKDAERLLQPELQELLTDLPIFYVPIRVEFLAAGARQLRDLLAPYFPSQALV